MEMCPELGQQPLSGSYLHTGPALWSQQLVLMPATGQGQQEGKARTSELKMGMSQITSELPAPSEAEPPLLSICLLCFLFVARNLFFFLALLDAPQISLSVTLIVPKKITISLKTFKPQLKLLRLIHVVGERSSTKTAGFSL